MCESSLTQFNWLVGACVEAQLGPVDQGWAGVTQPKKCSLRDR